MPCEIPVESRLALLALPGVPLTVLEEFAQAARARAGGRPSVTIWPGNVRL